MQDEKISERAITAQGPFFLIEAAIAAGDYAPALRLAEEVLSYAPENLEALRLAALARTRIAEVSRPPSPDGAVPHLLVRRDEIARLAIDSKAAFVLSHIDGHTTIGDLVDIMPLPGDETRAIVEALLESGVLIIG